MYIFDLFQTDPDNPCAAQHKTCGVNASCRVSGRNGICYCNSGFTGNADRKCSMYLKSIFTGSSLCFTPDVVCIERHMGCRMYFEISIKCSMYLKLVGFHLAEYEYEYAYVYD